MPKEEALWREAIASMWDDFVPTREVVFHTTGDVDVEEEIDVYEEAPKIPKTQPTRGNTNFSSQSPPQPPPRQVAKREIEPEKQTENEMEDQQKSEQKREHETEIEAKEKEKEKEEIEEIEAEREKEREKEKEREERELQSQKESAEKSLQFRELEPQETPAPEEQNSTPKDRLVVIRSEPKSEPTLRQIHEKPKTIEKSTSARELEQQLEESSTPKDLKPRKAPIPPQRPQRGVELSKHQSDNDLKQQISAQEAKKKVLEKMEQMEKQLEKSNHKTSDIHLKTTLSAQGPPPRSTSWSSSAFVSPSRERPAQLPSSSLKTVVENVPLAAPTRPPPTPPVRPTPSTSNPALSNSDETSRGPRNSLDRFLNTLLQNTS